MARINVWQRVIRLLSCRIQPSLVDAVAWTAVLFANKYNVRNPLAACSWLSIAIVLHLLDVGVSEWHVGDRMASNSLSYWMLVCSFDCMLHKAGLTQVELGLRENSHAVTN